MSLRGSGAELEGGVRPTARRIRRVLTRNIGYANIELNAFLIEIYLPLQDIGARFR